MRTRLITTGLFFPLALICFGAARRADDDFDHDAIRYRTTAPRDQISVLQKQLDTGRANLLFDSKNGYLLSVLQNLNIPTSSQLLVFSKTSFQRDLISPEHPRALYFNDNTYIGWVQYGSVLEVATTDSQLGAVFYTLSQVETEKPKFERQTYDCLQCHSSSMTEGVPGLMMRSMYTRRDGQPEYGAGSYLTTDQSPLEQRWGGWYVTGKHGNMQHMEIALQSGLGR